MDLKLYQMKLKKINERLQQALAEHELVEANELQSETFSYIKSGADAVVQYPATGANLVEQSRRLVTTAGCCRRRTRYHLIFGVIRHTASQVQELPPASVGDAWRGSR